VALRLLLVDDHPVVRRGLAALLDTVEGLVVVGQAGDGEGAVREATLLRPDVVVMDLRMPGPPAPQAIRRVLQASSRTGVLVLTMEDAPAVIVEVLHAGARAVLLKGADVDDVVRAVHAVAAGQLLIDPALVPVLVGRLAATEPTSTGFDDLSPRELDVLRLLGQGLSTAAIAERLGVAGKTVSNHTTTLLAKLGVATRQEATRLARDAGVVG
jgi:DNA-binding NarL/FixJ family response regulator